MESSKTLTNKAEESFINKACTLHLSVAVLAFTAFNTSFNYSYKISGIIILSSYFFLLFKEARRNLKLDRSFLILVFFLSAHTFIELTLNRYHSDNIQSLDPSSKAILFIPFALLLFSTRLHPNIIPTGFAIGGIFLGLSSAYDVNIMEYSRASGSGSINPIQLATVAVSILGVCLCFLISKRLCNFSIFIISAIGLGAIGALYTTIQSGTKGAWLAIPVVFFIALIRNKNLLSRHAKWSITIVLILSSIGFTNTTTTKERFSSFKYDLVEYFKNENPRTSTGIRLDLWKESWAMFINNPIIGVGQKKYNEQLNNIEHLSPFTHSHNAYLDAAAKRGLAGLASTLFLLFLPVILALNIYKQGDRPNQIYIISLISLSSCYLITNMTQTIFTHNNGVILYVGMMIILSAGAKQNPPPVSIDQS